MFLQQPCLLKNLSLIQITHTQFFRLDLITFYIEQLACVGSLLGNSVLQPSAALRLCTIYRSYLLVRYMGACCPVKVNYSYIHYTKYRLLMVTRKFKQKAADVTLPGVELIGLFLYVHALFEHDCSFFVCMYALHSLLGLGGLEFCSE